MSVYADNRRPLQSRGKAALREAGLSKRAESAPPRVGLTKLRALSAQRRAPQTQDTFTAAAQHWPALAAAAAFVVAAFLGVLLSSSAAPQAPGGVTVVRRDASPRSDDAAAAPTPRLDAMERAGDASRAPAIDPSVAAKLAAAQAQGASASPELTPLPPPNFQTTERAETMAPAAAPVAPPIAAPYFASLSDAASSPTRLASPPAPEAASAQPARAPVAPCLVKVDGKVVFQRSCAISRTNASRVTLDFGGQSVVVALSHGETWRAAIGARALGSVYRTGDCWGRRKQVYICAYGG